MRLQRELIDDDPEASFRCFERRDRRFDFNWHHHRACELTLVTAGHGTRFVGDAIEPYTAPDLVLLGGELPHSWWAPGEEDGDQAAIVIQFEPDRLEGLLARPEGRALSELLDRARHGLAYDAATAEALGATMRTMPGLPGLVRYGELLALLGRLAARPGRRLTADLLPGDGDHRIDRACAFIMEHADGPLSLGAVAAAVDLSPEAFARSFKRHTGRTVVEYVHHIRVARACDRLRTSDATIASIAFDVGFGNLANFNRVFKRLRGMTPRAWRKAARAT